MARARRWGLYMEGTDEIIRMFEEMQEDALAILEEATEKATKIVMVTAKQNVPVDTGELRDSLDMKLEKTKKKTKKSWQIYTKVSHAAAVEFGTSRMAARPKLRQSLDRNKNNVLDKIAEVIVSRLEG